MIKLSICIATFNRGKYIGETLDSILPQLNPLVEIVVVDGASSDNTSEILVKYVKDYPAIRYYRESVNSGVDVDYDKAVGYALGEYCWLMTDDDLLHSNAISRVLESTNSEPELIVVNSEVRNVDFSKLYAGHCMDLVSDMKYDVNCGDQFFIDTASYLSFIGGVVIKRQIWLQRNRAKYFGTQFIHVGVIFQNPSIKKANVLAEPLIVIRYGNGMWSARSFEIWTFKWPNLIWSFLEFSEKSRQKITKREPRKSIGRLIRNRGLGAFSRAEIKNLWPSRAGKMELTIAFLLSKSPPSLANFFSVLYLSSHRIKNHMALHDLLHSKHAGIMSQVVAKLFNIKSRNTK
jgi:glycosyltransferase involved in cell wall biosynthesis